MHNRNDALLELAGRIAVELNRKIPQREWTVDNSDSVGLVFLRSEGTKVYLRQVGTDATNLEIGVNAAHMVPWELNAHISLYDVDDPSFVIASKAPPAKIAWKMTDGFVTEADAVCALVARRVARHHKYRVARAEVSEALLREWRRAGRPDREVHIDRTDGGLSLRFPQTSHLPLRMVIKEDSVGLSSRTSINPNVARALVRALAEDLNKRERKRKEM